MTWRGQNRDTRTAFALRRLVTPAPASDGSIAPATQLRAADFLGVTMIFSVRIA